MEVENACHKFEAQSEDTRTFFEILKINIYATQHVTLKF